jgi:hypothetical protein
MGMTSIRLGISAFCAGMSLAIFALATPAGAAEPQIDRQQCAEITQAFTGEFKESAPGKLSKIYVDSVVDFIVPDRKDANCSGVRNVVVETGADHASYVKTYMALFHNAVKLYDLGVREQLSAPLLTSIDAYASSLPMDESTYGGTAFAAVGLQFDLLSLLVEAQFAPEHILRAAWDTVEFKLDINDLKTLQDNATIWKYDSEPEATSLGLKAIATNLGG